MSVGWPSPLARADADWPHPQIDRVVRRHAALVEDALARAVAADELARLLAHRAHVVVGVVAREPRHRARRRPLGLLLVGARRLVELAQPAGVLVDRS